MNRTWTIIIIIIIVVLIGWWIYASRENAAVVPGATTTAPTTTAPTTTSPGATNGTSTLLAGPNAIYVVDQPPDNRVVVSATVLESPGYVVIRRDVNGVAGAVLGNSMLLPAGGSGMVVVNLPLVTVDGLQLIAELHTDNGDRTFNISNDPVVRNARGQNVAMSFTISSSAQAPREIMF